MQNKPRLTVRAFFLQSLKEYKGRVGKDHNARHGPKLHVAVRVTKIHLGLVNRSKEREAINPLQIIPRKGTTLYGVYCSDKRDKTVWVWTACPTQNCKATGNA